MGQEYYRRELDLKLISGNDVLKYEVQITKYKLESRKYEVLKSAGVMNDVVCGANYSPFSLQNETSIQVLRAYCALSLSIAMF